MNAESYTLTVYTTASASVTINGTTKTANSSGYAYFTLKKGTYSYTVSRSGYTTRTGNVTVTNNQTLSVVLSPVSDANTILLMHCDYNTTDEKGHSNSVHGTSRFGSGKFSYGMDFDGSWYVHFNNGGFSSIIETNYWTIEFWLYPRGLSASDYIMCNWYSNQWSWVVKLESNKPRIEVRGTNGFGQTGSYSLTSNAWNHLAFVRSGGSLYIYTNGNGGVVQSGMGTLSTDGGSDLDIAYKADTSTVASSFILDEIRISKVARYTSSFTPPSSPFSS